MTYGLPRQVDPHEALLEEVHRTAGAVEWLSRIVADLDQDGLTWGRAEERSGSDWGTTHRAAPAVWLDLYQTERRHLVAVCKTAIGCGIDERRVRLAEQQGALIVQVIRASFADLGVPFDEKAGRVVAGHLRVIDGGRAGTVAA